MMSRPPAQTKSSPAELQSPLIENFLATVLPPPQLPNPGDTPTWITSILSGQKKCEVLVEKIILTFIPRISFLNLLEAFRNHFRTFVRSALKTTQFVEMTW